VTYLDLEERLRTIADMVAAGQLSSEDLDRLDLYLGDEELATAEGLADAQDEVSREEEKREELERALFGASDELELHANALDNLADDVDNEPDGYTRADIARDLRAEARRIRDTAKDALKDSKMWRTA
jgi:hypothetical protein